MTHVEEDQPTGELPTEHPFGGQLATEELPDGELAARLESYRGELLAHCYRMLGSVDDAEDVVQETLLRAWRFAATFDGRASLRTWLYRIATNTCLTVLRQRGRRVLPSGLGPPSDDPHAEPRLAAPETLWLQPIPDALVCSVSGVSDDPAAVVVRRDSLRLALIACLQHLPPRQRAVLLLRDTLGIPAAEVAEVLDISTAAVKSLLQRARARLEEVSTSAGRVVEPAEPERRALLEAYMAAFANADAAAIERVLCVDATLEFPPSATWFAGRASCAPFLGEQVLGVPGQWLMVPVTANGQPAAATYQRDADGIHRAFGVVVLTVMATGIARIVAFEGSDLVARFGLPTTLGDTSCAS